MSGRLGLWGWVLALVAVGILVAGGYTLTSGDRGDEAGSAQDDGGLSGGDQTAPEPVPEDGEPDPTPQGFTAITAGEVHSCGLRTDGTAQCCGNNSDGQTDPPPGAFTAVTTGGVHSCGLRTDGTVQCWNWTTNLPEGVSWTSKSQT